jgi:hypothetical protein
MRRITVTSSLNEISRDQLVKRARIFKRLWSPGIDSKASIPPAYVACRARICKPFMEPRNRFPGGPVRQPYLSYRPAMLHRLAESNPRNRFLVSLNVYKYGPWRAVTITLFLLVSSPHRFFKPPAPHHPFLHQASGQIFEDDVNGFPSISDILFICTRQPDRGGGRKEGRGRLICKLCGCQFLSSKFRRLSRVAAFNIYNSLVLGQSPFFLPQKKNI